jgi:hypothetical protein
MQFSWVEILFTAVSIRSLGTSGVAAWVCQPSRANRPHVLLYLLPRRLISFLGDRIVFQVTFGSTWPSLVSNINCISEVFIVLTIICNGKSYNTSRWFSWTLVTVIIYLKYVVVILGWFLLFRFPFGVPSDCPSNEPFTLRFTLHLLHYSRVIVKLFIAFDTLKLIIVRIMEHLSGLLNNLINLRKLLLRFLSFQNQIDSHFGLVCRHLPRWFMEHVFII